MCGIVGVVGKDDVTPRLVEGLKRLEYRGYDSAGVATLIGDEIGRRRAEGKLMNLDKVLADSPLDGDIGIGHTRWATHGVPNEANAHPHATDKVALVHNGIIENYRELARELTAKGRTFASETDTEIVAHLITVNLEEGMSPREAVAAALKRLEGAFALGIIFAGEHNLMIGARRGSPLAIGFGDGEMFLGSDAMALAPMTNQIAYLKEGDYAVLSRDGAEFFDEDDNPVSREVKQSAISGAMIGKGNHRHFMLKEIYEQPAVVGDTLHSYLTPATGEIKLPEMPFDLGKVSKFTIIACGTSYYSAMVAKYWFEQIARVSVEIDVASEFRYREAPLTEGGVGIFISQSGETADTLAALRYCRENGQHIMAIVNVPESSIARESDVVLQTLAGPEIGVASTKAFTCQLATLACLVIATARARNAIDEAEEDRLARSLAHVPALAAQVLNHDEEIQTLAGRIFEARDVLYLGRGTGYPLALEGALKLKEISYIHAEGYASGEMKHGPIALIDELVPVIVIAPTDNLFDKTVSNMREVMARGGKVIFLSDREGLEEVGAEAFASIELPDVDPIAAPLLYAIPVQLLAYHIAVLKGTDVDQPRNLAKSVTVE